MPLCATREQFYLLVGAMCLAGCLASGLLLLWQLRRPDLRDWKSQTVELDADGAAGLELQLPDDLPTGRWTALVGMPGDKGPAAGSCPLSRSVLSPAKKSATLDIGEQRMRTEARGTSGTGRATPW